ncbi:hypothetical protein KAR50_01555 [Periweissella fabaria]|uniref:Fumarate hydratase class II n=1 Tax=Periweissella fabaria TaxID=546157 RepID=A0ABM8Z4J2_9LACO|nr:lyase family protein [Periweissella fabaria]MCM0596532.1 hypothetical protein [Periweissella fabaria]CAH0415739.1 Fumarate hydratase class II [Periweissella fabaria]
MILTNTAEEPVSPISEAPQLLNPLAMTGPTMPIQVVRALLHTKRAAARCNIDARVLDPNIGALVIQSCEQLLTLDDFATAKLFPIHIYREDAVTQVNTRVNQLIIAKCSQINPLIAISSTDIDCSLVPTAIFPTVTNIVAAAAIKSLIYQIRQLNTSLQTLKKTVINAPFMQHIAPEHRMLKLTTWLNTIEHDLQSINTAYPQLLELPINHAPLPTQRDTPDDFEANLAQNISLAYEITFSAGNKFFSKPAHLGIADVHNTLHLMVTDLRTIITELTTTGSSSTPDAVAVTAVKIMGNDASIAMAVAQSQQTSASLKPIIVTNFLESCALVSALIQQLQANINY